MIHILIPEEKTESNHWDPYQIESMQMGTKNPVCFDHLFTHFDDFTRKNIWVLQNIRLLTSTDIKLILYVQFFPYIDISISQTVRNYLEKYDNTYIWFFCPWEHLPDDTIKQIAERCNLLGLPREKIIVTSCNGDFIGEESGIFHYPINNWHESLFRNAIKSMKGVGFRSPRSVIPTIIQRKLTKKYLCLLQNSKYFRFALYYYLRKEILSQGFLSYYCYHNINSGDNFQARLENCVDQGYLETTDFEDALEQGYMRRKKILDQTDSSNKDNFGNSTVKFYADSYFSIVSESNDKNSLFVTEKTFKPIAHCHPFILQGSPKILEYLKENNYETYDDYFPCQTVNSYQDCKLLINWIKEISAA
jgi:hypothetical protein